MPGARRVGATACRGATAGGCEWAIARARGSFIWMDINGGWGLELVCMDAGERARMCARVRGIAKARARGWGWPSALARVECVVFSSLERLRNRL